MGRTPAVRSAEFLGEPDQKPFRPADIAEPVGVLVLDHFAHDQGAALAEPFKRLIQIVHREHHAQIAQGVHRGVSVIRDDGRHEEAG